MVNNAVRLAWQRKYLLYAIFLMVIPFVPLPCDRDDDDFWSARDCKAEPLIYLSELRDQRTAMVALFNGDTSWSTIRVLGSFLLRYFSAAGIITLIFLAYGFFDDVTGYNFGEPLHLKRPQARGPQRNPRNTVEERAAAAFSLCLRCFNFKRHVRKCSRRCKRGYRYTRKHSQMSDSAFSWALISLVSLFAITTGLWFGIALSQ